MQMTIAPARIILASDGGNRIATDMGRVPFTFSQVAIFPSEVYAKGAVA